MIIFYGLGNNASKYLFTKHNIGRIALEQLTSSQNLQFSKNKSYFYTKSKVNDEELVFLYSDGFMNTSGVPLVDFCKYHPVPENTELVIIHDDSDQKEGCVKLLPKGGSAGHNGIRSIYSEILSTPISINNVWRLKIGIRPEQNTFKSETFVLSKISQIDERTAKTVAQSVEKSLPLIVDGLWSKVQTQINSI